jgi:hypothetical protein
MKDIETKKIVMRQLRLEVEIAEIFAALKMIEVEELR